MAHIHLPESSLSFADLPLELQRQIWAEAAKLEPHEGPRIHCLQELRRRPEDAPYICVLNSGRSKGYHVPSLLGTSREAREAGLKENVLVACQCVDPTCSHSHVYEDPSYIYFNKRHDMLRVGGRLLWHWSLVQLRAATCIAFETQRSRIPQALELLAPALELLKDVRNLVLDWPMWFDLLCRDAPIALYWIQYFPSLETITVLLMGPQHDQPPGMSQFDLGNHLDHQVREVLPYTGKGRSFSASMLQSNIDSLLWDYGFANPGVTVPTTKVMALCIDGTADDENEDEQEVLRVMMASRQENWKEEHGRLYGNIV